MQRGRKSAAEMADTKIASIQRPTPPANLTSEQKKIWKAVVMEAPPSEFTQDKWPFLESYCVHTTTRRKVDKLINEMERDLSDVDMGDYKRLCEIRGKETSHISSLAIRLNIAQSTAYERRKSSGKAKKAPWQS